MHPLSSYSRFLAILGVFVVAGLGTGTAQAHFQLVYTPDLLLDRGGVLTLKMPFTHPAASGYVMEMAKPQAFQLLHRGEQTDLSDALTPTTWTSAENTNTAYEAQVRVRRIGDYVFALTPEPYLEESEDAYIQQITKTILNIGGLPTDWDAVVGLPAEIRPLNQPYGVYAGGTFSGVVLGDGEPVPFAEIEVEYMNFPPDVDANAFGPEALAIVPNGVYETLAIRADANGTFTFGLPRAGFWGFAALGVGPETSYNGKDLSQDAVLWVQARALADRPN